MSTQTLYGTDAQGNRHEYEYLGPWIITDDGVTIAEDGGAQKHSTRAGHHYLGFVKVRRLTDGKITHKRTDRLFIDTTPAA